MYQSADAEFHLIVREEAKLRDAKILLDACDKFAVDNYDAISKFQDKTILPVED